MPAASIGRGGRIKVDAYNKVEGFDNIYSIGDQCIMSGDKDYPNGHPQLAQVAIQQGNLLAENLIRIQKGKKLKPFRYRNLGSMATVGRNKAVAEFSSLKTQGWIAWFLWLVVHLRSILGVRNKLNVLFNWMWSYMTYDHSLRLILYPRKAQEVIERENIYAPLTCPFPSRAPPFPPASGFGSPYRPLRISRGRKALSPN